MTKLIQKGSGYMSDKEMQFMKAQQIVEDVKKEIARFIVGQEEVVEQVLWSIFAGGDGNAGEESGHAGNQSVGEHGHAAQSRTRSPDVQCAVMKCRKISSRSRRPENGDFQPVIRGAQRATSLTCTASLPTRLRR